MNCLAVVLLVVGADPMTFDNTVPNIVNEYNKTPKKALAHYSNKVGWITFQLGRLDEKKDGLLWSKTELANCNLTKDMEAEIGKLDPGTLIKIEGRITFISLNLEDSKRLKSKVIINITPTGKWEKVKP